MVAKNSSNKKDWDSIIGAIFIAPFFIVEVLTLFFLVLIFYPIYSLCSLIDNQFKPNVRKLSQIQMPEIEGADFSELSFADMIKEMSFKQWIAEDGYLIMKSETHVEMEISPEDVGASVDEFQKITADQSAVMVFCDYNEPVSIELPAEALDK